MKLDKMTITLRERQPWEALDLGVMLMRSLWLRLLGPWSIMMIIALALCLFLQLNGHVFLGFFLLWLFKPVYDSLVLHILSRGVFNEYPSLFDTFRDYRQWLKTGVMTSLFWWRFSASRSFNLSVHQLEGLKGRSRKQRLRVLLKTNSAHAMGLTVLAIHFEILVNLTLYGLMFILVPDQYAGNLWGLVSSDEASAGLVMNTVFYWLAVFVVEPFYMASGFALYLNRRTQLEAWDVELAFRNINQRLTDQLSTQSSR